MAVTVPAVALEASTRARLTRLLRAEAADKAEALRAAQAAAEARVTLRRQDRVRAAVARMQPFVTRIEDHLRKELRDAQVRGDHNRRILIEGEIDELFRLANQAAQEAGR
jgi:hypothetical protein